LGVWLGRTPFSGCSHSTTSALLLLMLMFLSFIACFLAAPPGAGDFGVVLLALGHSQIDGGWVEQFVSCPGVSWLGWEMCGGFRPETAACSTTALVLHAGGVACVWWALSAVGCGYRLFASSTWEPYACGVCFGCVFPACGFWPIGRSLIARVHVVLARCSAWAGGMLIGSLRMSAAAGNEQCIARCPRLLGWLHRGACGRLCQRLVAVGGSRGFLRMRWGRRPIKSNRWDRWH